MSMRIVITGTVQSYLYVSLMLFCHLDCDFIYGNLLFLCIVSFVGFFSFRLWFIVRFPLISVYCVTRGIFFSLSRLWFLVRFHSNYMRCWCCFAIRIVISCTVPSYLYVLLMLFCHPDCDFLYGSLVFVCYALLVFLVSSTWIVIVFGTFVSSALCCLSVLWFFVRFSLISILYLLELCYARNLCMLNI